MPGKVYSVTISRVSDDDVQVLVDRDLTADEAIDLMLHVQENVQETAQQEEEVEEENERDNEPEPTPSQATSKTVRAPRVCGNCGEPGHNRKTCPKARGEAEATPTTASPEPERDPEPEPSAPEPPTDHRSLREQVKELWEDGLSVEEIYDYIPHAETAEIYAIYQHLESTRFD